ncbi:MAG: PAS domain-containing sensor histidine kinase [Desulfuromonas sp.]|nr:MAG: PAS domain-containing sensor histidine kinase [Desulfuromonas sp.]
MSPDSKQTEQQIYSRVLDNLDRAVIAIDQQGHIILFNPTAQSYTGLSEKQSLGRNFENLFAGQDSIIALVRQTLAEGRSISDDENIYLSRASSPDIPISVTVSPIFGSSSDQEGAVMIIRDLSRVRELEEALRHADRLSMLGTLAAGLAHEIKNPLGGIRGAAQLLEMELDEDSSLGEYTTVMIKEVERVNGIIEELMDLSHPRPPAMSNVNLAQMIDDIVLLQQEAHREQNIRFTLELDPSIPPIRGDEALLTRLFLNLIKNAAEAVPHDGHIKISCKIASDYHVHNPGRKPVPWIVVKITDNGPGISATDRERIFTPFYTTKQNGSGLGLATCQKIVGSHQGFISVKSKPNEGTTFRVSLPFIRQSS